MGTIDYVLPAHWASYLINGDASGMDDAEQAEVDAFTAREGLGFCVDCSEESWFAGSNDAGTLAGDVCQFTFEGSGLDAGQRRAQLVDTHPPGPVAAERGP